MAQISPKIFKVSPAWNHDPASHEYNDIQSAIDDIPAWGKYIIELQDDFSDVQELRLTNDNIQVKIDGQGSYGIMFRAGSPICTLDGQKTLKFSDMTYIRGDGFLIRADSFLYFYNCQSVMTYVDIIDGKYAHVYIYDTNFYGSDGHPAITVYNPDSKMTVHESFIKGGRAEPALLFRSASNNKIKMRNSVVLHYDGVDNFPIQKIGAVVVGIKSYGCVGNARLCSHDINNTVDEYPHDTFDKMMDF